MNKTAEFYSNAESKNKRLSSDSNTDSTGQQLVENSDSVKCNSKEVKYKN